MKQYLLDTNICIFYMKGLHQLDEKLEKVETKNCFISEITLAELKFGVENSQNQEKNHKALMSFLSEIQVVPILQALDIYAKEKARLKRIGKPVDDFDLLIGATAVALEFIMVTNNISHFDRIKGIKIEDWSS